MDENTVVKRLLDMSKRSYNNNTFEFSDFLTPAEQEEFLREKAEVSGKYTFFGGYGSAERRLIRFGDPEEFGYEVPYPVKCLCISPVSEKFSTALSHRDFLGALMNLGVERRLFGDIVVKEKSAYVFVNEKFAEFVYDNLIQVGRNNVHVEECVFPEDKVEREKERIAIQVNSLRADAVAAKVCKLSRGAVLPFFKQKLVLLNGIPLENNDKLLKEGDVFSVRGYGKFVVGESGGLSKKGKENVAIYKYT